jgi:Alginate export
MTPHLHRLLLLTSLVLCAPAAYALQDAVDEGRSPYKFLRQGEDWSAFRISDPKVDLFDPLKRISLNDDGDIWVSFGGRVEARWEAWSNFAFDASNNDDFLLSRALLHTDLHVKEHLRFFIEGKTAQSTSRDLPGGVRTLDRDTLALQQAFVDFKFPLGDSSLTVRPGRQALSLGNQRLVSPLPWGNTLRTWQGLTGVWSRNRWQITGLATVYVPVDKTEFNKPDHGNKLHGLYAKRAPRAGGHGLELYWLHNEREDVTVNGTSGDERRETLGSRLWGPITGLLDYELEAAYQLGEVGSGDVSAWFLAADLGHRFANWAGKPRFWLGLDLASGDDEVGGDVGTFHQLFPLGHAFLGYIDAIGRQNIWDTSVGGQWQLDESSSGSLALHSFRVMDTADALYNAGGAAYRSGFSSRDVGFEFDALVDRKFGRHSSAYLGYSHFFAGDAIAESGPAEDTDFLYLGVKYTF